VRRDDEGDPGRFFGEGSRSRRGEWKLRQLCKQVERAAAVTLASECADEALFGAAVASVEPAPDAGRLRVTVVLAVGGGADALERGRVALLARAAVFRSEVARSVHRKRAPEIVFDVRPTAEVDRG
jgi:hypothetical protein